MLDVKDHYKPTMPEASLNQRLIVAAQGASSWCHVCGQPAKCSIKDHNANRRHADYKPRDIEGVPVFLPQPPLPALSSVFPSSTRARTPVLTAALARSTFPSSVFVADGGGGLQVRLPEADAQEGHHRAGHRRTCAGATSATAEASKEDCVPCAESGALLQRKLPTPELPHARERTSSSPGAAPVVQQRAFCIEPFAWRSGLSSSGIMTLSVLGEVLAMSDPNVWVCMSTEATWIVLGSDAKPIFQNRHVAHLCPLEHRAGFQLNDLMKPGEEDEAALHAVLGITPNTTAATSRRPRSSAGSLAV